MRRIALLFTILICFSVQAFSQANRNTRFISVQSTNLKSSAGFFADTLTTLSFGDAVTLIQENGRWSRVRFGNYTGWVASSCLTRRQVVPGTQGRVSANEVAFGGKGFSPDMEIEYRSNGLDFSLIDTMEQICISSGNLLQFINEGRLFTRTDGQYAEISDDGFTLADNYYLGRVVAANILSSYSIYTHNPQLTQYLNSICQTLVINSAYPEIFKGYFVMILDSDELNAFSTPGGHIFITKGLLKIAGSEDQLAAIIAHELAHIMLRHGNQIINEIRIENDLINLADWAAGTAAEVSEEAALAAYFRRSVSGIIDVIMRNGYSITQEYEADMEAIVLLAGAGYDPGALLEMLRILQQVQGFRNEGLYSTHPNPAQRIDNLRALRFNENNTQQYRVQRFVN